MLRYRLDELGWAQFEALAQSLLKAHLGLTVEAWGGRGDHGCDAFSRGPLYFPVSTAQEEGPFVFQAKFVEGANAAGARPEPVLSAAVEKETARIARHISLGQWSPLPRHYALLTNAVLPPERRQAVRDRIRPTLPQATVTVMDGQDVSALLDSRPEIRRAFPQILSLRDLDTILREVVDHEILERSAAAQEAARSVVPVFVPTGAYRRAWGVLRTHKFVVLEGPPEMGKSAIAWTIALVLLSEGWEAIVCDSPDDFFQGLRRNAKQVFVADDAFGRTEYDPGRGHRWEQSLHRVLTQLNANHWLVWTSRKHILERALHAMDLEGEATTFPRANEVLVDTAKLTVREKALILYRQGKARALGEAAKAIVKGNAGSIVRHDHFTPERIRQFVSEQLPTLDTGLARGDLNVAQVREAIGEAIRNPTPRMRKTFRALPASHKWCLFALLEARSTFAAVEQIELLYRRYCPAEEQRPFPEVLDELNESFVTSRSVGRQKQLDWMHPSYRDLVIEEVPKDRLMYERFLRCMSVDGVKLALSDTGGATGARKFPLITDATSWRLLGERCEEVAATGTTHEVEGLLSTLSSASAGAGEEAQAQLGPIVSNCLERVRPRWSARVMKAVELKAFCLASEHSRSVEALPDATETWSQVGRTPRKALTEHKEDYLPNAAELKEWADLVDVLRDNDPRFLRRKAVADDLRLSKADLQELAKDLLDGTMSEAETADEARGNAYVCSALGEALETAGSLAPQEPAIIALSEKAYQEASTCEDRARELDPEEGDDGGGEPWSGGGSGSGEFDIDGLFVDF